MTRRFFGLVLVGLLLAGCGGGTEPQRYPVSGTVTLDGQPLPEGLIFFKTVATGAIDTMEIKAGKFAGEAQPGERRVEIVAYRESTAPGTTPGMEANAEVNYIPPRYNSQSTLTAQVKPEGPNEFSFEVTSK